MSTWFPTSAVDVIVVLGGVALFLYVLALVVYAVVHAPAQTPVSHHATCLDCHPNIEETFHSGEARDDWVHNHVRITHHRVLVEDRKK